MFVHMSTILVCRCFLVHVLCIVCTEGSEYCQYYIIHGNMNLNYRVYSTYVRTVCKCVFTCVCICGGVGGSVNVCA